MGSLMRRANQLAHHLRALRGWSGDGGGAVRRALARDDRGAARAYSRRAGRICRSTRIIRRERLAFMLADAGARVLVTQAALLDRLALPTQARAPPWCGWMRDARGHRARSPRALRCSRSTRTTPPMSSTPQAQPERRRASWSRHAALSLICMALGCEHSAAEDTARLSCVDFSFVLTSMPHSRSCCRFCAGRSRVVTRGRSASAIPAGLKRMITLLNTVPSRSAELLHCAQLPRRSARVRSMLAGRERFAANLRPAAACGANVQRVDQSLWPDRRPQSMSTVAVLL